MRYKIHAKYEGEEFWTYPEAPKGYCVARRCDNCAKHAVMSTGPLKMVCNEVTEYQGVRDNGTTLSYSRQAFYTPPDNTCDEHRFEHEMDEK